MLVTALGLGTLMIGDDPRDHPMVEPESVMCDGSPLSGGETWNAAYPPMDDGLAPFLIVTTDHRVSSIRVLSPEPHTAEGAHVGMTESELLGAVAGLVEAGSHEPFKQYVLESEGGRMSFVVADSSVGYTDAAGVFQPYWADGERGLVRWITIQSAADELITPAMHHPGC